MKRILLLIGIAASALFPLGAQTLVVTSLTAALGQTDGDIPVASVTGVSIGTAGYVDQELFRVIGIAGKTLRTARGVGGVQSAHISGSLVYFGQFHTKDPVGACSDPATSTWLNSTNGKKFQCAGGKWAETPILSRDISTPSTVPPSGHTLAYTKGGAICALSPAGVETCTGEGSGGSTPNDFATTLTSGTVITVDSGSFRYGTNFVHLTGPFTFTLQTVSITSIVTGSSTTINVSPAMTNLVDGQSLNVALSGTGSGCTAGTGVFVATTLSTSQFSIPADTSAGCTSVSGTVGAQTGGTAIIFGNTAGQVEMSHSAAMGALVSASGTGAVVSQTSTGLFPNGSVPIASVTVAAGAFDTVTDYRAFFSSLQVQSGAGIDVTMVGGQPQIATASNIPKTDAPSVWVNSVVMKDATKTLPWRTGTGSPDARDNCANLGEAYFQRDTPTLWVSTALGTPCTWSSVAAGSGALTLSALTNTALGALTNTTLGTLIN